MGPNPQVNAKCDVMMKLSVFAPGQTHTHTRQYLYILATWAVTRDPGHYILATWAVTRVPGHYLRHSVFCRFDTVLACDRHTHTDRHMTTSYTALA